jgi:uncharacterized protein (DUF885 family)
MLGEKDPDATLYTLMCHEGIPGHLMQGDIQVRQTGTPQFRKAYTYVAFNEGWALYAERLCSEMGAFPDAAADLERLDAELSAPRAWWSTPDCTPRTGRKTRRCNT